jgi:XTP/dITP diphosphohydrolase
MIKQLLLATHNPAKIKELRIGVKELEKNGIQIVTLNNLNISEEPEETGKTFEENARLKAKYYGDLANLSVVVDDGGLIIPFLNNEPGVKSRRWLGRDATDQELIDYTIHRLSAFQKNKRTAYLKVAVCFYNPKTKFICFETEKIKGYIAEKPSGKATEGYPFRALFIVEEFNKYYDELTGEEHEKINHRLKAVKRLVQKIKNQISKCNFNL